MSPGMNKSSLKNNVPTVENIFCRILTSQWLRPERALWDAHALNKTFSFLVNHLGKGPNFEYGCTDGVPTFVMLGGEFKISYDDYMNVDWERNSHKNHDSLSTDYFDSHVSNYKSENIILKKPLYQFDYGLSWKESHIKKAEQLSIYKNLLCANLGDNLNFFKDNTFSTILAPNLFWLEKEKLDPCLIELKRILKNTGQIITIFPDIKQLDYLLHRFDHCYNKESINDLDRGIHVNLSRHAKDLKKWKTHFSKLNLSIARHETFIPSIVNDIYQIGFRPMFPVFMNIYEKIKHHSIDDWIDFKQHWIDVVFHFMSPLCDSTWMKKEKMPDLWHIFELKIH